MTTPSGGNKRSKLAEAIKVAGSIATIVNVFGAALVTAVVAGIGYLLNQPLLALALALAASLLINVALILALVVARRRRDLLQTDLDKVNARSASTDAALAAAHEKIDELEQIVQARESEVTKLNRDIDAIRVQLEQPVIRSLVSAEASREVLDLLRDSIDAAHYDWDHGQEGRATAARHAARTAVISAEAIMDTPVREAVKRYTDALLATKSGWSAQHGPNPAAIAVVDGAYDEAVRIIGEHMRGGIESAG